MLDNITYQLQSFFIDYGTIGVFLGSIIEEIIAPIPSTVIILGSSFFILKGQPIAFDSIMNLILNISIPAGLGMTLGSLLVYGLCYRVGKPLINKWGKYLFIKWENIEMVEQKFEEENKDELMLFGIRSIPFVPSVVISAFCGIIRYDLRKYITITFLGSFTRATILGFLGWQFGSVYKKIAGEVSFLEYIVIIIVVIALVGYLIYNKRKFNKNK